MSKELSELTIWKGAWGTTTCVSIVLLTSLGILEELHPEIQQGNKLLSVKGAGGEENCCLISAYCALGASFQEDRGWDKSHILGERLCL